MGDVQVPQCQHILIFLHFSILMYYLVFFLLLTSIVMFLTIHLTNHVPLKPTCIPCIASHNCQTLNYIQTLIYFTVYSFKSWLEIVNNLNPSAFPATNSHSIPNVLPSIYAKVLFPILCTSIVFSNLLQHNLSKACLLRFIRFFYIWGFSASSNLLKWVMENVCIISRVRIFIYRM